MNTKIQFTVWLCLSGLSSPVISVNASDEFEQWLQKQSAGIQSQKKEFQEYKDKRDKDFTAYLQSQWKAVDILKGRVRDDVPKPDLVPIAPPEPVTKAPVPQPKHKPVVISIEPLSETPVAISVPESDIAQDDKSVVIDFYGRQVMFGYDGDLQYRLNQRLDKNAVSDFWSMLSRSDYDQLLKQLSVQKDALRLNDWAYASMVNKVSSRINSGRQNESALLSWFLLIKSGYSARIAYDHRAVYLLLPSQQEMFDVSYFVFRGKRYYAVDLDGATTSPGKVYTYDSEYEGASKGLDMRVTSAVVSGSRLEKRYLAFEFEGKKYNIEVNYDINRIKFLSTYPQLSLDLYFDSGVYPLTATTLHRQLAEAMTGMSETQAVNFLLRFVQTSLQYETDEQQFGKENYLFPEETLFYPYSDCEDRAVLFAWLVKSLLKLDVVGLDYPGHVATAVHFHNTVPGDSINYRGKRYVVSDPTYVNANVGVTMPDFRPYKPVVIAY